MWRVRVTVGMMGKERGMIPVDRRDVGRGVLVPML